MLCYLGNYWTIRILEEKKDFEEGKWAIWRRKEKFIWRNISKKNCIILFYFYFLPNSMQISEQAELLSYVNIVCTPFSIAGAFYMIYSYFKSCTKSFSSKLVFCLALSDLLLSICDVIDIFDSADN